MIARVIEWSARNLVLVFFATALIIAAGVWSLRNLPIDAIPDLSDVQVIVLTDYPGQAPQVVEDQVTYPLTSAMLTVPRSRVVRGFSFFGISFVYIIFEDGVDPYWGLIPESAGSYVKPLGLLFWPPVFACEEDMCPSEG